MANALDIIIPAVPGVWSGNGRLRPFDAANFDRLSIDDKLSEMLNNMSAVRRDLRSRAIYASGAACMLELVAKQLKATMEELALHYGD